MAEGFSEAELAELAGCSPERVRELVGAGVIPAREAGFRPGDVQRVWLADALEQAGTPLEHVATGIRVGRLSLANLDVYFPEAAGLSAATCDELSGELGRPARPREVLVSEDVRRAAELEGVAFEEIGEIPLKGIPTPVALYRAAEG